MGQGLIGLDGHQGIPDGTFVGMESATAKVLCSQHNSALSALDSEAKRLSDALGSFQSSCVLDEEVTVDGPLFERWLMKVSMGYLAAGHTQVGRRYPAIREVVAALFGIIPMKKPIGMYSMINVERPFDKAKEVLFRELVALDPQGQTRIVGAFVALHGLPFLFSFGGPFPIEEYLRRPDGSSFLDPYDCTNACVSYRPNYMRISEDDTRQLKVRFRWPG